MQSDLLLNLRARRRYCPPSTAGWPRAIVTPEKGHRINSRGGCSGRFAGTRRRSRSSRGCRGPHLPTPPPTASRGRPDILGLSGPERQADQIERSATNGSSEVVGGREGLEPGEARLGDVDATSPELRAVRPGPHDAHLAIAPDRTPSATPPILPSSNQTGSPTLTPRKTSGSVQPITAGESDAAVLVRERWPARREVARQQEQGPPPARGCCPRARARRLQGSEPARPRVDRPGARYPGR